MMKRAMALVGMALVVLIAGPAWSQDTTRSQDTNGGATLRQDVADRIYLKVDFAGGGNGVVQITPGSVECSKNEQFCAVGFRRDTEVLLTAKSSGPNSSFTGWTGPCMIAGAAGPDKCRIVMKEDISITANFADYRNRIFPFNFPKFFK